MVQGPSWEADSHSAGQETPRLLEFEGSLPCSQKLTTELDESGPNLSTPFP
jgi:hypothetical protein